LVYQAVAVIGIALIAMGEDVGAEMALRQFQHLVSELWFFIRTF
jgi:26S proteasome regulatory subunit N1